MTLFGPEFVQRSESIDGVSINFIEGGSGDPLLLLHGYPQTHAMWHQVAPRLARHFRIICPDLRGYGDSDKPSSSENHFPYSKRAMAADMLGLMARLGFSDFMVVGHDRGGRVTHRMCLDAPQLIRKACVIDIVPTHYVFANTDKNLATSYYHWFFLIQPDGFPEKMIGFDPEFYLREKLKRWSAPGAEFDGTAVAEYLRCFSDPLTIHASCEDYRAGAGIDLEHDEQDRDKRIECPLHVLWGSEGFVNRNYDVIPVWQQYATHVTGKVIHNCGHFPPEEAPDDTVTELQTFFA